MAQTIELDRLREVCFDIKAVQDVEHHLGKPLGLVLSDIQNFGVSTMITALWIGLQHEDKTITRSLTQKLFTAYVADKKNLRLLIRALSDAMEETGLFRTDDDEAPEGNARPEPATP